jgi:hypothetical protein
MYRWTTRQRRRLKKSDVHRIAPRPELDTLPPPNKDLGRRAALAVFVALLMPALIIYLRGLFSKPTERRDRRSHPLAAGGDWQRFGGHWPGIRAIAGVPSRR